MIARITYIGQRKISKKGTDYRNVSFFDTDEKKGYNYLMAFGSEVCDCLDKHKKGDLVVVVHNGKFVSSFTSISIQDINFLKDFNNGVYDTEEIIINIEV